ncbi:hypothetical protein [Streptomyces hundungensis]|uniref:hypothetical protein n=1 Tax=Streptomyces hundungensis TaxID=1077946 RepID=UPI0031EEE32B
MLVSRRSLGEIERTGEVVALNRVVRDAGLVMGGHQASLEEAFHSVFDGEVTASGSQLDAELCKLARRAAVHRQYRTRSRRYGRCRHEDLAHEVGIRVGDVRQPRSLKCWVLDVRSGASVSGPSPPCKMLIDWSRPSRFRSEAAFASFVGEDRPMAGAGWVMVIGALGLASVALATAPAFAKGSVEISAPKTVQVGRTITVTAHGDDDNAGFLHQLCVEENGFGEGWHQETGSTPTAGDAKVTAAGASARRGDLRFRAVLYGLTSKHDPKPVHQHTSAVVTVHVR